MSDNKYQTLGELKRIPDKSDELIELIDYIQFASEPHENKGGPGAVCPFL